MKSWQPVPLLLVMAVMVLLIALLGGLLGLGAGYLIGTYLPDYYQTTFSGLRRPGGNPAFDPVHLGMGLGLVQGLGAGLVVGIALALIVAWCMQRNRVAEKLDELKQEIEGLHNEWRYFQGNVKHEDTASS